MTAPSSETLTLEPIAMVDAVGYADIPSHAGTPVEESLVLKHDRLFLLVDGSGNVAPAGDAGHGLFADDTRMLSHYELRVPGGAPARLSAQVSRMYAGQIDLAVSGSALGGDSWHASNVIHLRRELLLDDRLTERLVITNFGSRGVTFPTELHIANDFADIFEVRGWERPHRGTFYAPRIGERSIRFLYRGRDGALLQSELTCHTAPDVIDRHHVRWNLRLEPQESRTLEWHLLPDALLGDPTVAWDATPPVVRSIVERRTPVAAIYDDWRARTTRFSTDVAEFDQALQQAVGDLRALYVHDGGEPVISAGIPWYSTPFGRDSIITSLQTLSLAPGVAVDTLRYLARHQGTHEDSFTEEQPGKIMHELRRGELARAREIPHLPYYGTVDATPLWLVLLHETWRWTGDAALVRELMPHAERALAWIDRYGDMDGDGLVEYAPHSEQGLVNQGWKDSWDGIPFPSGALPTPPIALVEVQGYVYDAKMRLAALHEALGDTVRAIALRQQAAALRERILAQFWIEELGTFALALDGEKRPLPTITSNAGHLLWSRVPDARRAALMRRRLMAPDMFSGWGVRTLSTLHAVYNPMSYHNGSVWPHDNAILGLGCSLYDATTDALPILSGLYAAATTMRHRRLPELFCGMPRSEDGHPVLYPVSCSPQAWAAGAFFMLLQAVTGLLPDAAARTIHIREPLLPPFLGELRVEQLRVGGSRVALQFTRRGTRTLANLLSVEGDPLQVRIELS